jgi:opacity protein-like surface antigen
LRFSNLYAGSGFAAVSDIQQLTLATGESVMNTLRQSITTALVLVTLITCVPGRATAQQPAAGGAQVNTGEWSITPFAGFGFSGDLDSATGALGVAGGYGWSPTISLEGEFNVLPSSETGGLIEVNSNAWSLTGNLLYHFAPRPFRPYGVIGLGFGHSSVDVNSSSPLVNALDSSSTEFVVNLGGGVERAIRENLLFRGDLRYFFGGDLVPDYWRFSAGLRFAVGNR